MDRKAIARETLEIMKQGYYMLPGNKKIEIGEALRRSVQGSSLITPEEGERLLSMYGKGPGRYGTEPNTCCKEPDEEEAESISAWQADRMRVENISTVDAIRKLFYEGKEKIGVLNFASAKNPGGGFLNGAMAQEESLAASGTLYRTLVAHEGYYEKNRAQKSMMYTDHGIYSPDVVFFRDGRFGLVEEPVKASVLTLPAVNMGQVLQKGEDAARALKVMRRRMELALAIFAHQGAKDLVLGAYGCGVFRNDPGWVAQQWKEILSGEMGKYFDGIFYAVLDGSRSQACIKAFEKCFMG